MKRGIECPSRLFERPSSMYTQPFQRTSLMYACGHNRSLSVSLQWIRKKEQNRQRWPSPWPRWCCAGLNQEVNACTGRGGETGQELAL